MNSTQLEQATRETIAKMNDIAGYPFISVLDQEINELDAARILNQPDAVTEELGDVLFILLRKYGWHDLNECLESTLEKLNTRIAKAIELAGGEDAFSHYDTNHKWLTYNEAKLILDRKEDEDIGNY